MNGFKRVNPSKVEAMQGAAAALAEMSVKEDELTATAQVNFIIFSLSYSVLYIHVPWK